MKILGYLNYRNFLPVIKKAIAACENSDISASDHFAQVRNMIETGKGASKPVAPQGAALMAISQNEKGEMKMTARELIKKMEIEELERGLFFLGQYTGRGNHFVSFPDAEVQDIDEVEFAEYYEEGSGLEC